MPGPETVTLVPDPIRFSDPSYHSIDVYGVVPPEIEALSVSGGVSEIVLDISAGCVTDTDPEAVQPSASVTTREYVPGGNDDIELVVAPLLHRYVYGARPPDTETLAVPSEAPLHVTFVFVISGSINEDPTIDIKLTPLEHPAASLTLTKYVAAGGGARGTTVPALSPDIESVSVLVDTCLMMFV